ncbi:MAG: hypothetical protein LBV17_06730 [Treponema sp.]|jgi:hypothetical protein|nr:hypothetical protein [Treponema sp.]
MQTNIQDSAQHERDTFPFWDSVRILDIRYDLSSKPYSKDTAKSRGALSDLIPALTGRVVSAETIITKEPPVDGLR